MGSCPLGLILCSRNLLILPPAPVLQYFEPADDAINYSAKHERARD